jgi:transposase
MSGGTILKEGLAALIELRDRTDDVAAHVRLTAVIAVYQGVSISELSRILGVSRASIYSWVRQHRRAHRADILLTRSGSGRSTLCGDDEERVIAQALESYPIDWGYSSYAWTAPILCRHLFRMTGVSVTPRTIRRALLTLGYAWKRPRYLLAPDPDAEKKTPNSAENSGISSKVADFISG